MACDCGIANNVNHINRTSTTNVARTIINTITTTTSTTAAALAAFYAGIPVGHVEAGLRTGDRFAPWPEEMNRMLTGRLADLHFAPTDGAADALRREAVDPAAIHVTGNTVIDALLDVTLRARALS